MDKTFFNGLGAFETSFSMIKLAENNEKENIFLNAGRGNPNWINTQARLAFNRLIEFGIKDSKRTIDMAEMAGYTTKKGIAQRFEAFLEPDEDETDNFLMLMLDYLRFDLEYAADDVIKELVDGAIGNNYPEPSRVLPYTELIINKYLESTLYDGEKLSEKTKVFPTEGGTAAIVYIFNSLKRNHLIQPGDKIAINTPIFTPYLQIPELSEFDLVEVYIDSDPSDKWNIRVDQLDKLADPDIKAFFIVNPSNPASTAFSDEALAAVKKAVESNPDLMIITDDVYGTFVEDFRSIYAVLPYNTLLVYSYSKLFGATGWRLGLIAVNDINVFDKRISELPQDMLQRLRNRYKIVTGDPSDLPFIERLVADSRSVGLYHTAGLSTPQQIMEALFSLSHLVHRYDIDPYFLATVELIDQRYQDLHKALKFPGDDSRENAKYYSLINIYELAEKKFGKDFRRYFSTSFPHNDFLKNLAEKNGVVLMDGSGFGSREGNLRISQANLPTEDYYLIGKQIIGLMKDYYEEYQEKMASK
ncbi:bifunctional aspartate transaminase/aspartate 4-decarboxylase [Lactovum miscens]|uniref:Aminotransferase n=1 Tax=Lactovum miscens TaxID=190387 RepID=A0A841C410_9LACT|nr:bifunctional aspartate transaminase/aspartate 4-decarboxylase [Lactovum miscens]MBB5887553.1 aspartate 4-decarboxylase [Lactovum miscens]